MKFEKDFTQQEPLCRESIDNALGVLETGRLHRYNLGAGEKGHTALLEEEFAEYMGMKYCLATASCGAAMYIALKSAGVTPGDRVLCNAFTLAPVPGAIENSGADIRLVEITDDYTVDLADLALKAADPKAKWFLMSHMRGHLADMDRVMEICRKNGLTLIEDCAHTMGAAWDGRKSGSFGKVSCFSTQTYKHMNSGEGGFLVTDDEGLMARAILFSGSYMNYDRHLSRPALERFQPLKTQVPNYSSRMDHLRAAILRPQVPGLDSQVGRWNRRYQILEQALNRVPGISCPRRPEKEHYVGSSIQFSLDTQDPDKIRQFLGACLERGVELKWFGSAEPVGFTSAYASWQYLGDLPDLPNTNRILAGMCDMRIPLTFSPDDCRTIAAIIADTAAQIL